MKKIALVAVVLAMVFMAGHSASVVDNVETSNLMGGALPGGQY